jgi:hypothetical protein
MSYAPETGYEAAYAPSIPGNKGPLRFEEGVATDTDVPFEFGRGAYEDTVGSVNLGWPIKDPMETMRERAHVGSATWIEAPMQLSEFVQGAGMDHPNFERVAGSEMRIQRWNPTRVG